MSIIVDEYRQQAVQQLFKKDLRKIKNFLTPNNIIKFKNYSNLNIELDFKSMLQIHTTFSIILTELMIN